MLDREARVGMLYSNRAIRVRMFVISYTMESDAESRLQHDMDLDYDVTA